MKKILKLAMILSLLSFFVACDDNSAVDSGSSPVASATETITATDSDAIREITYNPVTMRTASERSFEDFESFKAAVENGEFVREDNWCFSENIKYIMQAYETEYTDGTFLFFDTTAAEMVKTEKFSRLIEDGVLDYQFDENGGIEYDHVGVIQNLITILDDTVNYLALNDNRTIFKVLTSEKMIYTIDLNRPLIANPVEAYNSDFATGYYTYSGGCLN